MSGSERRSPWKWVSGLSWVTALWLTPWLSPSAPWKAIALLVVGTALWIPGLDRRLRVGLIITAATPVLLPALHETRSAAALLAALAISAIGGVLQRRWTWRIPVASLVMALCLLLSLKQVVAATALPAATDWVPGLLLMGVLLAALVLGTPTERWSGGALLIGAGVVVGTGLWLGERLQDLPPGEAAALIVSSGASDQWPALEARLNESMLAGSASALDDATQVIQAAPGRTAVGVSLLRIAGPQAAADAGWDPQGPVPPNAAIPYAWELERRGLLGRGVRLLRQQEQTGELAFHLAVLAGEAGNLTLAERAWKRARPPAAAAVAPGTVVQGLELPTSAFSDHLVACTQATHQVRITARGEAFNGAPELLLRIGPYQWGPTPVPAQSTSWHWKQTLPPGAYRLRLQLVNDASGPHGDRNLHDVGVALEALAR